MRLLAASVLDLLATIGLETGTGPDEDEMDLEQPFEPRWRAGRLSIGYEEDSDQFLLEIEEFQPELEEDDPLLLLQEDAELLRACSRPASRCSRSRDTRRRWSTAAGPPASTAATPSTRRDTRAPR